MGGSLEARPFRIRGSRPVAGITDRCRHGGRGFVVATLPGKDRWISLPALGSGGGGHTGFRRYLVEQWRVPREKISVIENGVERNFSLLIPPTALKRQLGAEGKFERLNRHNRNGARIGHDHRSCHH